MMYKLSHLLCQWTRTAHLKWLQCLVLHLALSVSDIPFEGPIAGVQVGRIDGKFIVNPTPAQLDKSDLDLVVAGTKDAINMVEAGAKEVAEDIVLRSNHVRTW